MYSVIWRLISLLFGLIAFGLVFLVSLYRGEELLTTAVKSICAFFVLWLFFSVMGVIFTRVVPTGEEETEEQAEEQTPQQNNNAQQTPFPTISSITDDALPEIEVDSELGKAA